MKRQWTADELAEHWTLHPGELDLLANKSGATRLGFAVLLKYFQCEGQFPLHKGDIPPAAIVHLARQLALPPERYAQYAWTGRTIAFHRTQIRHALGFREATVPDAEELAAWLAREVLPHDHRFEQLRAAIHDRCRACHLEPPAPSRVDRIVRSALRTYEERLYQSVLARIGPEGLARIDDLLAPDSAQEQEEPTAEDAAGDRLTLHSAHCSPRSRQESNNH